MSTFSIIGMAMSGLAANQKAIEVTGHNVANANTPGYHRQEAIFQTLSPYPSSSNLLAPTGGMFGTGVEVSHVRRVQNNYLETQFNSVLGQQGHWQQSLDGLQQLENIVAPGEGQDLSSMLDKFFSSWQSLASHPENLANRMAVRGTAVNLASMMNSTATKLTALQKETDLNIEADARRINQLADTLGKLNGEIGLALAEGRDPNDYLDSRATVLADLAKLAGITTTSTADASGIVNLGGRALVQGTQVHHLQITRDNGAVQLRWEEDGAEVTTHEGELAALFERRDVVIPTYTQHLDDIASTLITEVNALHVTGVTMTDQPAGNFFEGSTASGIRVADDIVNDAGNIATTTQTGAPGDGSLATSIFSLSSAPVLAGQSLNQRAQGLVSIIGNDVSNAKANADAHEAHVALLDQQMQSVAGVSLDEEMGNLLVFQRAYDASARVLQTADEMLQTLLQTMG